MSMAIARRLNKGSAGGGGIGQLIGQAVGAAAGFLVGGPPGAIAGSSIGGGVGGAAGGMIKKPEAPSESPMQRRQERPLTQIQPPEAPQVDSHSPILEESLMALKEIPEEFQERYKEPLIRAYALSFKQDRSRGLA